MNGLDSYLKSENSTPKIKKFLVIDSDSQNQFETKSSEFKVRQQRENTMKCDQRKHMSANSNRSKTKSLFNQDTVIKFSSIDLTNHKKFISEHDMNMNFTTSGVKQKGTKINMNKSKVSRFNQNSDMFLEKEGFLNDYIKRKKSQKSQSNFTLMDIHRVESECSALQKLIDKLVKKEAELSVRKYNLLKYLKGQEDEKNYNESSNNRKKRQKNIAQNLSNIYKTVQITKKKVR